MSETTSNQKLGEYLRSEREKRHISIEQIASATKINIKLLHALEADNYEALPAKPFVRGFVNNYARYIGLDPKLIIEQYDLFLDTNAGKKFKRPDDMPHLFVEKDSTVDRSRTILGATMMGFLIFGLVAMIFLKPMKKKHHKHTTEFANSEVYTVPLPPGTEGSVVHPAKQQPPAAKTPAPPAATTTSAAVTSPTAPAPTPVAAEPKHKDKPDSLLKEIPGISNAAPASSDGSILANLVTIPSRHPSTKPAEEPAKAAPSPSPAVPVAVSAPTPAPSPSKPAVTVSTPVPAKPIVAVTAPAPTPAPSPSKSASASNKPNAIPDKEVKHIMMVIAKEDSWVKYQSDDRAALGYTLKSGQKIYIKARESIRFMSGNPKAIEFSYNRGAMQTLPKDTKSVIFPSSAAAQYQNKMFIE